MIWVILKSRKERTTQREAKKRCRACTLLSFVKDEEAETQRGQMNGHQFGRWGVRESQVLCWTALMYSSPCGSFTQMYIQITRNFFRMYFSQDLPWCSDSGGLGVNFRPGRTERTAQVILKATLLGVQCLVTLWFLCFTPRCLLSAGIICV